MLSEEKHVVVLVCGGVPGCGVLGCEWKSAVCGSCGADGSAGGVGVFVRPVGPVIGFLDVLLVWLFLL